MGRSPPFKGERQTSTSDLLLNSVALQLDDESCAERVSLLGRGACRGPGWQDGQWPLARGRTSLQECAQHCKTTPGCVAFDLSNKDGERWDCCSVIRNKSGLFFYQLLNRSLFLIARVQV